MVKRTGFIVIVSLLLTRISPVVTAETLILTTGEWPPFITAETPDDGPITQVVRESFALVGQPVEIQFHPWKRAMEEVRVGRADGSFAWRITEERQKLFLYSDAVYVGRNVFFHLKSTDFQWSSFADLGKYKIGAAQGYAYSSEFIEAEKAGLFSTHRVNDEKYLASLLIIGRIDAFPANREVGHFIFQTEQPTKVSRITYHPKSMGKSPVHIIALKGKDGEELVATFNEGLQQLVNSGRMKEIYDALLE